jgi:Zn-dependent alcohol dehydrogenase
VKHTRIVVTHYGGPDALQVLEEDCPEPKAGEVRVRVLAAGVGRRQTRGYLRTDILSGGVPGGRVSQEAG